MRLLILAAALMAAACAPTATTQTPVPPPSNGAVPAPTPSDIALRLGEAQNGQTVEVAVGQRFAVELVGVPTAGYVWAPAQTPAFLRLAGEATGNTSQAQSQPGFAGGNHWEVLIFAAEAPGTGELVIEQRRPWETNEPANQTFRVTIVAR
ncbi:MAG: protease inhibitor I42 family protein [Hyphomonadaceae bacterium]|nr:protease inhibitor I42 family protein [Hyphomonadaceae bacterium]